MDPSRNTKKIAAVIYIHFYDFSDFMALFWSRYTSQMYP